MSSRLRLLLYRPFLIISISPNESNELTLQLLCSLSLIYQEFPGPYHERIFVPMPFSRNTLDRVHASGVQSRSR